MNLRIVILPAKVLADGSHKLRIAVSHNSQTRYIPTRFTVPSPKNLKKGNVVNVPNAQYINLQLRTKMNDLFKMCDELESIDSYSCAQLVKLLTKGNPEEKSLKTVEQISADLLKNKGHAWAKSSVEFFERGINRFIESVGKDFVLAGLTTERIIQFHKYLEKLGHSATSINMRVDALRRLVQYAIRRGYVHYKVYPFLDYKSLPNTPRDIALTLEQLRKFRDLEMNTKGEEIARDLFMLSFYLCGMNLVDMLRLDLTKDSVKFIRQKTISRRQPNDTTEFTIQPEARVLLNKYLNNEGKLKFYRASTLKSIQGLNSTNLKKIKERIGCEKLIYYSARKTFTQLANELMIKDSLIEYCIGDSPMPSSRSLAFYTKVNKRMADIAIRKVFDAVASTKSLEELVSEIEG